MAEPRFPQLVAALGAGNAPVTEAGAIAPLVELPSPRKCLISYSRWSS